ncbi:hypothetical protein NLU13_5257 [Sarocladium strictum]|uniref:Aminoglycoside phosphotransferase domain-containing protein n=1 Tax=Sarocladium strictum TaxID=5046 RepID=A0AA39L7Q2_SARSR|nr:hypothetical protein NLU13_5257 [Sarocladium strictum]
MNCRGTAVAQARSWRMADFPAETSPPNHARGHTATPMDNHDQVATAVRAHIAVAVPRAAVTKITRLPNTDHHPLHRLDLSDGTSLMLNGPALPRISGMTVSGYSTAQAEAIVLSWLAYRRDRPSRLESLTADISESGCSSSLKSLSDDLLLAFLPQLVRYFELDTGPVFFSVDGLQQRRSAYNLVVASHGRPAVSLDPPLSREERRSVALQSGKLLRMLSDIQSPNGRFGFAAEVLADLPLLPREYLSSTTGQRPPGKRGHHTWSEAYERLLIEARDEAQRRKISAIPFARLHRQFERFRGILDHVMRPQLVLLHGGDESITLVHRHVQSSCEGHAGRCTAGSIHQTEPKESIRVVGFRDWSDVVFGDPLVAKALCTNASKDTINGFTGDRHIDAFSPELPPGLVDDRRNVTTRLLLYRCFWIIKEIVRRPTLPFIQGVQAAAPSPAWMELSDTLTMLESQPSPMHDARRRPRNVRVGKRRRSESPPGDRIPPRVWDSRSQARGWHERRRSSTP